MSQNGRVEAHRTFSPHFLTTTLAISSPPLPCLRLAHPPPLPPPPPRLISRPSPKRDRTSFVFRLTLLSPFLFLPPAHRRKRKRRKRWNKGSPSPLLPSGGGGGSKKSLYLHAFPELEEEEEKLFSFPPLFPLRV